MAPQFDHTGLLVEKREDKQGRESRPGKGHVPLPNEKLRQMEAKLLRFTMGSDILKKAIGALRRSTPIKYAFITLLCGISYNTDIKTAVAAQ